MNSNKQEKNQYVEEVVKALENPSELVRQLITDQRAILEKIKNSNASETAPDQNTFFEKKPFDYKTFSDSSKSIVTQIPFEKISNHFNQMITNYPYYSSKGNEIMNIGQRISETNSSFTLDEWCNVLNEQFADPTFFSLHKSFDLTHFSIRNLNSSRVLSINFNESFARSELLKLQSSTYTGNSPVEQCICSVSYLFYHDEVTNKYKISQTNPNELTIEQVNENQPEQEYINKKKRIVKLGHSSYQSNSDYIRTKGDYKETKHKTKTINDGESFGTKKYGNSCNRVYCEEWKRSDFDKGHELKVHSFLDDGVGTKLTKDFGNRKENDNEVFNYCDTYTENIASGESTLIREGKDLMNEWHCSTKENKLNKTELTENKAKNFKDNLEWYEMWSKSPEENFSKKWGRSVYEEWEEDWNEVMENGELVKKCNKKCKKLLEDKEWKESWTEKKGDLIDDKTCYKMNRIGNEKYEHYWGDVKVNYLDNKRMNYDGFILNDTEKQEYFNYY